MRTVSSLEQLAMLPRDRGVNGFVRRVPLRLEIPHVARHALLRAERALNRLQSRCGCVAGGVATLVALAFGVIVLAGGGFALSWRLPLLVLAWLALALLAGLAGKFLVLALTRWQFARACRVLHRRLLRSATGPGFPEE